MAEDLPTRPAPTSADVLLANQLYYKVQAKDYDNKNHVTNPAIIRYYRRMFEQWVFDGASDHTGWRVCDVGCGTGFLESILHGKVGRIFAVDATVSMLHAARVKFPVADVSWLVADARSLPLIDEQFDLVCSNAMLHHVHSYEDVLIKMVGLLKPGGKLFLGYEPNAVPYRLFWPFLKLAAKIVPEHRDRHRIQRESGQEQHPALRGFDIHEMAEFQIFHGRGINPFRLRKSVSSLAIADVRIHFSSIFQIALLKDSGVPVPMERFPDWVYPVPGPLCLSFSLTGTKVG
jgi:ubiquinone/menaquinone biosynthesis C-methylase UbiE